MFRANLNLRNVLFDKDSQVKNIEVMIGVLEKAVANAPPGTERGLIYGEYKEKKSCEPDAVPFRQLLRDGELPDYSNLHTLLSIVKKQLQEVVLQAHPLVLVWIMILFMFVSTEFNSMVCKNTEQKLAIGYFDKFADRINMAVFGHVIPKKPRKKIPLNEDQILHPCDHPLQIVLNERLLFMRLQRLP